jgi:hypothetical protein
MAPEDTKIRGSPKGGEIQGEYVWYESAFPAPSSGCAVYTTLDPDRTVHIWKAAQPACISEAALDLTIATCRDRLLKKSRIMGPTWAGFWSGVQGPQHQHKAASL